MTDAPAPGSLAREFRTRRSLGLLVAMLALAAVFAALAHWQISRAVDAGTVIARPTERVVALTAVAAPGVQQTEASIGRSVRASGRLVPQDTLVAGDRLNRGTRGWWVVGHAVLDEPAGAQLAVALGWAPTAEAADRSAAALRAEPAADSVLVGRYVDSDAAAPTAAGAPAALVGVSAARLVNVWDPSYAGPTYEGLLVLRRAPAGLTTIWSPPPGQEVELNLLNVLYAAEWTLFAVFAIYVWYRLVRDRWERRQQVAVEPVADPARP